MLFVRLTIVNVMIFICNHFMTAIIGTVLNERVERTG